MMGGWEAKNWDKILNFGKFWWLVGRFYWGGGRFGFELRICLVGGKFWGIWSGFCLGVVKLGDLVMEILVERENWWFWRGDWWGLLGLICLVELVLVVFNCDLLCWVFVIFNLVSGVCLVVFMGELKNPLGRGVIFYKR